MPLVGIYLEGGILVAHMIGDELIKFVFCYLQSSAGSFGRSASLRATSADSFWSVSTINAALADFYRVAFLPTMLMSSLV